jgi:hypothetical protein
MRRWVEDNLPIPPPPPFPEFSEIVDFLNRFQLEVRLAERAVLAAKPPLKRDKSLLKALGWLKDKQTRDYDFSAKLLVPKNWHWWLGDLLITLEASKDMEVYTTDRHFLVLCPALGRQCQRLQLDF